MNAEQHLMVLSTEQPEPDSDYARQAAAIQALEHFHAQRGESLSDLKQAVIEETGSALHGHLRSAEEAAQTILGDPTRLLTPSLVLVMDAAATLGPLTRRATRNYLMEAHYWASTVLDEPPTYTLS